MVERKKATSTTANSPKHGTKISISLRINKKGGRENERN